MTVSLNIRVQTLDGCATVARKRNRAFAGAGRFELVMNDSFCMYSTPSAATSYTQISLQVFQASGAFIHASTNCFVIHCFADANKHSDKRNETQSHVKAVHPILIKKMHFPARMQRMSAPEHPGLATGKPGR